MKSFISEKVQLKRGAIGQGLFAVSFISKGEVIVDYTNGPGKFLTRAEAEYAKGDDYILQIDDDLFFAATNDDEPEDADFINHSCEPNCGIKGLLAVVAMRDIAAGEEITFDYAVCESSNYVLHCLCGTATCRGKITGGDWKRKDLQLKYQGYFSDYLQRKIMVVPALELEK